MKVKYTIESKSLIKLTLYKSNDNFMVMLKLSEEDEKFPSKKMIYLFNAI